MGEVGKNTDGFQKEKKMGRMSSSPRNTFTPRLVNRAEHLLQANHLWSNEGSL